MSGRVLFLDRVHPLMAEALTDKGFRCEQDHTSGYEAVKSKLGDYVGVVIRSRLPMDAAMLAAGRNLRFVARSGAGLENIDLDAARAAGITVHNSPEGNRDAVGEHVIAMLLGLFNHLCRADAEVKNGVWKREQNRGIELSERTVGIIGYGHMGSALAEKLSGFGCEILAYDKYRKGYAPSYVRETDLHELQARCDVLSLHLPLSAETHHFVNECFISACTRPFYLVNTARGSHVCTEHLVAGLRSGSVAGACLDVLEYEKRSFERLSTDQLPEAFHQLAAMDNVVLSPHVAGWTVESYRKLAQYLADKVEAPGPAA